MRRSFFAVLFLCATATVAVSFNAQAQDASATAYAGTASEPATGSVDGAPTTVVLTGHVKTVAGPLPGAVVKIGNTKTMVVTDADGSFHVTVPANSGPLQATASYAGFADEAVTLGEAANELNMTTPRVIVVAKSQTMKAYRKTARKQVKRSIRRVQRSVK